MICTQTMIGVHLDLLVRGAHGRRHQAAPQSRRRSRFPGSRPMDGMGVLCCHYGWYNTRRLQKDLGYRSPDEYEAAWHADHAAQPATTIITPTPTGAR